MAEKLTEQDQARLAELKEEADRYGWHEDDDVNLFFRALAKVQAELDEVREESEGRRRVLCEVRQEQRREWVRAEQAEAALAQAIAQEASATGLAMEYATASERLREALLVRRMKDVKQHPRFLEWVNLVDNAGLKRNFDDWMADAALAAQPNQEPLCQSCSRPWSRCSCAKAAQPPAPSGKLLITGGGPDGWVEEQFRTPSGPSPAAQRGEEPLTSSMDNVLAWRLGEVANKTVAQPAGDLIDRGLILRRLLAENGFVVYSQSPPAPDAGQEEGV